MNTAKVYKDIDGNDCSIWQMVKREPEWAATRIQVGEKAITEGIELKAELLNWKNNHADMVKRNAELRDRPDLKDRAKSIDSLRERITELEEKVEKVYEAGMWGIAHVGAANYQSRCNEAEQKLEQAYEENN